MEGPEVDPCGSEVNGFAGGLGTTNVLSARTNSWEFVDDSVYLFAQGYLAFVWGGKSVCRSMVIRLA